MIYIPVYIVYPKSIKDILTEFNSMGFVLGPIARALFPRKKRGKQWVKKGQERADTRKHIKRTTRIIKKTVKEPDELPVGERVPAVREFLKSGT